LDFLFFVIAMSQLRALSRHSLPPAALLTKTSQTQRIELLDSVQCSRVAGRAPQR
jgi:hypothetical protein